MYPFGRSIPVSLSNIQEIELLARKDSKSAVKKVLIINTLAAKKTFEKCIGVNTNEVCEHFTVPFFTHFTRKGITKIDDTITIGHKVCRKCYDKMLVSMETLFDMAPERFIAENERLANKFLDKKDESCEQDILNEYFNKEQNKETSD
jgi:hypothetical protein